MGQEGMSKGSLNFEKNEATGEWELAAAEVIAGIDGFEGMAPQEKVAALVVVMKELSEDNSNRHVVEELAKQTKAIELYAEIEAKQAELSQLGRNLDVHV